MILPKTLLPRNTPVHGIDVTKRPSKAAIAISMTGVLLVCVLVYLSLKLGTRRFNPHHVTRPPRKDVVVLAPKALDSMPIVKYNGSSPKRSGGIGLVGDESRGCSICAEEFKDGAKLRLPPCHHAFHPECIDPWLLQRSVTCPL